MNQIEKNYNIGAAQTLNVAVPNASIQEANARLSSLIDKFGSNLGRMENIVSRAFGSGTGTEGAPTPTPVPNGEIGALNDRLGQLSEICDRQDQAISSLNSIV